MSSSFRTVRCVRHGEAAHNVVIAAGRAAGDRNKVQEGRSMLDPALTSLGTEQAKKLESALAAAPPDVIVTSPLLRALETTALIAGSATVVVSALHTESGIPSAGDEAAGTPCQRGARSVEELRRAYPAYDFSALDDWTSDGAGYFHPLGVEDRMELFRDFVRRLPAGDVVIVGHSGFYLKLLGGSTKMKNCELVECVM